MVSPHHLEVYISKVPRVRIYIVCGICVRIHIIRKNEYIERFAGKLYDPNSIILSL